ncbi:hypothetical protein Plhal304r1_c106g0175991 [Plasmopara halstedii]
MASSTLWGGTWLLPLPMRDMIFSSRSLPSRLPMSLPNNSMRSTERSSSTFLLGDA